ncbi:MULTISPECIES: extracellular solute-binding protein [unclassified Paenibacillus]|uniref:ABC transporter substrate-binding protein n=1 Tax=unclassified Paenibacillus TaxID=185978 RepID=UPI001AE0ED65|nr:MULTISPECIES: extracellular solute-binding protein [unclassified Paenibacillus]MBP1154910.1 iron(III) transport system substrate-binding protein [Paenibacillus sp. PvP091]MBP1169706.1 iron(III) transport system substrate-binding protein [Paenibacillus sp. PvR098]MBP2440734.1 iron(III) transport system substrate-binding protein [Paenibacillus sp. PvP052]
MMKLITSICAAMLIIVSCSGQPQSNPPEAAVTSENNSNANVPAKDTKWEAILEAAKKEGVVYCACPPRPDYANAFKDGFEKAYPGIKLEVTAAPVPEFPVRVSNEQKTGKYLWDVWMFGTNLKIFDLKNEGGFEPFLDYVVHPEVLDGSVYDGGLKAAFLDQEKKYIFSIWNSVNTVAINRNMFPDVKINDIGDILTNPMFKGKIVMGGDPRSGGSAAVFSTFIYHKYGEEGIKKLIVDQEAMITRGNEEATEQFIRGGKGIAIPEILEDTLIKYKEAGLNLGFIDNAGNSPDVGHATVGGTAPAVFKNPPHPNATKVFIHWVLSKEGQSYISKTLNNNSRRLDVPPVKPSSVPQKGKEYFIPQLEEHVRESTNEVHKISRELIK